MKIDIEKIQSYFGEFKTRHQEIEELLLRNVDAEILKEPWILKRSKCTLAKIAEEMANILHHSLAKDIGEPVTEILETIIRSGETEILPEPLPKDLNHFPISEIY